MRPKIFILILALAACAGAVALAQPPPSDPLGDALIPPDFIMAHQQELGLSDAQKTAIQADVQLAQARFTPAQWQTAGAIEKLAATLRRPHIDETKALALLDSELQYEREIKRTQLTLMIQVKNELTLEQQAKVLQLRHAPGQ